MTPNENKAKLFDDLITYACRQTDIYEEIAAMTQAEKIETAYQPSPDFENRIQRLFDQKAAKAKRERRFQIMKWIAAGLVLMIGISAVKINKIEAFRVYYFNTVHEMEEKSQDIRGY